MIISASRRTDIPAFYPEWMVRRLREGHVLFPYPRSADKLGSVRLSPENVDCIVFWTKNPAPLLDRLPEIDAMGYRYYFTFTITPYGPGLEARLPPKPQLLDTFRRLSGHVGPDRVDWRYDPVVLDPHHTARWHLERFGEMCRALDGAAGRCIVNFLKVYRHLRSRFHDPDPEEVLKTISGLVKIASEHHIPLAGCTETRELQELGIPHAACIDLDKIERITGWPLRARKDPGHPDACGCIQSVDIGAYDSCGHDCGYCYAVTGRERTRLRMAEHDPASPMLIGRPVGHETVYDRTGKINSCYFKLNMYNW